MYSLKGLVDLHFVTFADFSDLKGQAYRVAALSKESGYSDTWRESFIDQCDGGSDLDIFEEVIANYQKYLRGELSEEEGHRKLTKLEDRYNQEEDIEASLIDSMFKFQFAVNEAFKKSGMEYGAVSFTCPFCKGEGHAERHHAPNNLSHKITYGAYCNDCGHSVMA